MKESSTYQAILAEGQVMGEVNMLLTVASTSLGEPRSEVRDRITSISSVERLKSLGVRLARGVSSWDELLMDEPRED